MRYQFSSEVLAREEYNIFRFLQRRTVTFTELNDLAMRLDFFPDLALQLVNNSLEKEEVKLRKVANLLCQPFNFFAVLGAVGAGKTSLAHTTISKSLEIVRKKVYWVGDMDPSKVPSYAEHIPCNNRIVAQLADEGKSIFDLFTPDSIVYIDELSHIFPGGRKINQEDLRRLTVYRHKNLTILASTQNSNIISIDMIRFFTGFFMLQTTLFHSESERDLPFFQAIQHFIPKRFGECLFYSAVLGNEFFLLFDYPELPDYAQYNKSFSSITS